MKLATTLTSALAALTTARSNKPDECAVSHGRIDGLAYRYYSYGPKCAQNSDLGSIESSIFHNLLQLEGAEIPGCSCVKYDHGGAWDGWLLYGKAGEVDLARYCGPMIDGRLEWDCTSRAQREL